MFRRRPLMRAAVVGGGAYMVGKSAARRQDAQADYQSDQDARISALEQQQAGGGQYDQPPQQQPPQQAPPPAAAPAASSSMVDQLNQLAGLHEQGVLSDDEFSAAKAKLFGT
jgi:Short C-terminal domain